MEKKQRKKFNSKPKNFFHAIFKKNIGRKSLILKREKNISLKQILKMVNVLIKNEWKIKRFINGSWFNDE